jgi:hypothetical protein
MVLRFLVGCDSGDRRSVSRPRRPATEYRGAVMPLFSFVQAEFPWALGPSDGRHLLRDKDGQPQHIVVLATLGAPRRHLLGGRRGSRPATPDPAPVATARVTVIDAHALTGEPVAREWLGRAGEETVAAALGVVNRVLFAHRIAAADPHVNEVTAAQALVLRAGYGEGEAVAEGRWLQARELTLPRRRVRRTAALRPQERLALLLGGHHPALVAEELALRARLDLDAGRVTHAAGELRNAYAVGLPELERERRDDLQERLAELRELHDGLAPPGREPPDAPAPDAARLRHALERLEATLRARTATGFALTRDEHEGPIGTNPRPSPREGA